MDPLDKPADRQDKHVPSRLDDHPPQPRSETRHPNLVGGSRLRPIWTAAADGAAQPRYSAYWLRARSAGAGIHPCPLGWLGVVAARLVPPRPAKSTRADELPARSWVSRQAYWSRTVRPRGNERHPAGHHRQPWFGGAVAGAGLTRAEAARSLRRRASRSVTFRCQRRPGSACTDSTVKVLLTRAVTRVPSGLVRCAS